MTTTITPSWNSARRDWRAAFSALRSLLRDANDTAQVFRIMRSLNAGVAKAGYDRLLRSEQGGRIAYRRVELAGLLADEEYVSRFAPGTVGAAYAAFLAYTGYSAQGLAAVSREDDGHRDAEHPYAWFARRMRDSHDLWHVLTGYQANDPLGEACLVAFSCAQSGGLGWGMIAIGAAFKSLRMPDGWCRLRAIHQGYRNGRRARWLPGEDYERLLAEPLLQARQRLAIAKPERYDRVRANVPGPEPAHERV